MREQTSNAGRLGQHMAEAASALLMTDAGRPRLWRSADVGII